MYLGLKLLWAKPYFSSSMFLYSLAFMPIFHTDFPLVGAIGGDAKKQIAR